MRARHVLLFFCVLMFIGCISTRAAHAVESGSRRDRNTEGTARGIGTVFSIADGDYLHVRLESSETVDIRLESIPDTITMRISPVEGTATSTLLTITGLAPDTAYYKYEDTYHNLVPIFSDESGSYAYAQDISKKHRIFIQPKRSTKFIRDDETGGDCTELGSWDPATLTCTLSVDLTETIEIDSNGITLDGAGHTTTGSGTGSGVYLTGRSDVTIKNLIITDFSYGIYLSASSHVVLTGNSVSSAKGAIVLEDASDSNEIVSNTLFDNKETMYLFESVGNTVDGNTVAVVSLDPEKTQGIILDGSDGNTVSGNSLSINQAIQLYSSDENSITDNALSDTDQAIQLYSSTRNTIADNALSDSRETLTLYDSADNQVYHNNFIRYEIAITDYNGTTNVFNLPEPAGGNYFDTFDELAEGCADADLDGLCDAPYVFVSFEDGQDNLPWTTRNGWVVPPDPCIAAGTCASNVLFLPGIESSRLYEGDSCGGTAGEKLWEPYESLLAALRGAGDDKVGELALDAAGESVCGDIYTKPGDVIDAVRESAIYRSFIEEMDGLKADGTVNDWEPIAYDWRLSLDDLLANGAERDGRIYYEDDAGATSTPYIEQTLRTLAGGSKTSKVTIVAHSNGGLLAKALLNKLGGGEAAALVDKVIMVGAPQSGAPAALASALVGYDAGVYALKGLVPIVSNAAARAFMQNAPMAYHLLPSADYLASIIDEPTHPVVHFSGTGYAAERAAYGNSIVDVDALDAFLLAQEGGRAQAADADLASLKILNAPLVDYANSTHAALDSWAPPAGVEVSQVAGWGADTVAGIDFYSAVPMLAGPGAAVDGDGLDVERKYRPIIIEDGDGTVPIPSALLMAEGENVKRYWLDLDTYRVATSIKRTHADIFEVPSLQDFIENIITNSTSTLPAYISASQPAPLTEEKKLTFFLHSPLTLQLTDAEGNVTGLAPDDSTSEDIPGSAYGEFGEVKYVTVPEGDYTLTMHGQASGSFSLDMQESVGGVITASSTIANVPTTASTLASLTVAGGLDTASTLSVDIDGDGEDLLAIAPVLGETVNYAPVEDPELVEELLAPEEPAPEPSPAPVPAPEVSTSVSGHARAAAAPREATTTALATAQQPSMQATTTAAEPIVAIAPQATAQPARVARQAEKALIAAAPPREARRVAPPQTASVYQASQQSTLKKLGSAVYNGLQGFWSALRKLF